MVSNDFIKFIKLVEQSAKDEGINYTGLDKVVTFRASQPHNSKQMVYESGIIFAAQGTKNVFVQGNNYGYSQGDYLTMFMPMAVECEVVDASIEKPILGIGVFFDWNRMAKILLKIEQAESQKPNKVIENTSGIFHSKINDSMLDTLNRLMEVLKSPCDTAVLGDALLDELYYRILCDEYGVSLREHLAQRGQIQQIAKAVEYVHANLDKQVSVDELAYIVGLSSSGFHKKFKEVMHLSPLQYSKSVKLGKAQSYILGGKSVADAGYMVGYNSPAQFCREYKRHFGVAPSQHK
jgi:AraC-like DNA-binding protein